jgi:uncharacterized membrane protein YhaH (DUF805 family)
MEHFQWFLDPMKNHYFDFDGRATRQQFWLFTAWVMGISVVLSVLHLEGLDMIFSLVTLLPSLGIGARRLHDVDKSGWWQLLWLIPVIGWIILIVFLATQGKTGENEYGADPRATGAPSPMPAPAAPQATPAAVAAPAVSTEAVATPVAGSTTEENKPV